MFKVSKEIKTCNTNMSVFETTEGLYLTKDESAKSLRKSRSNLASIHELMLAENDGKEFVDFDIFNRIQYEICEELAFNLRQFRINDDRLEVLKLKSNKEVVIQSRNGRITFPKCVVVNEIEIDDEMDECFEEPRVKIFIPKQRSKRDTAMTNRIIFLRAAIVEDGRNYDFNEFDVTDFALELLKLLGDKGERFGTTVEEWKKLREEIPAINQMIAFKRELFLVTNSTATAQTSLATTNNKSNIQTKASSTMAAITIPFTNISNSTMTTVATTKAKTATKPKEPKKTEATTKKPSGSQNKERIRPLKLDLHKETEKEPVLVEEMYAHLTQARILKSRSKKVKCSDLKPWYKYFPNAKQLVQFNKRNRKTVKNFNAIPLRSHLTG